MASVRARSQNSNQVIVLTPFGVDIVCHAALLKLPNMDLKRPTAATEAVGAASKTTRRGNSLGSLKMFVSTNKVASTAAAAGRAASKTAHCPDRLRALNHIATAGGTARSRRAAAAAIAAVVAIDSLDLDG